ncbi:MAG: NYN domain-containing protein [Chloroflexi bacterium]|nr:NYN domain-containing protein [Chloroflexota bacterium]
MSYLIDGHNLIASLPDISLDDPNDEARLVNKLKGYCARSGKKCTVIFDGGLPGGFSAMSTRSVTVIFAASEHTNADGLIQRRVARTNDVGKWTVVSSDHEIGSFARGRRMKHMTSIQFARLLQSSEPEQESHGEEIHPTVSADEIDELYQAFGGEPDG